MIRKNEARRGEGGRPVELLVVLGIGGVMISVAGSFGALVFLFPAVLRVTACTCLNGVT